MVPYIAGYGRSEIDVFAIDGRLWIVGDEGFEGADEGKIEGERIVEKEVAAKHVVAPPHKSKAVEIFELVSDELLVEIVPLLGGEDDIAHGQSASKITAQRCLAIMTIVSSRETEGVDEAVVPCLVERLRGVVGTNEKLRLVHIYIGSHRPIASNGVFHADGRLDFDGFTGVSMGDAASEGACQTRNADRWADGQGEMTAEIASIFGRGAHALAEGFVLTATKIAMFVVKGVMLIELQRRIFSIVGNGAEVVKSFGMRKKMGAKGH